MPQMATLKATKIAPPPGWALLERELIRTMEEAAPMMVDKYTERPGNWLYADDVDDHYEMCYNWGLFYALGGSSRILDLALQEWNATTRFCDDSHLNRKKHYNYYHGKSYGEMRPQIHNEYYNYAKPLGCEWHHMGEGNMAFYDFGVADPTISENVRRAKRFAAMFTGDDPQAPNYDKKHGVLRSIFCSSQGPYLKASEQWVEEWLIERAVGGGQYKQGIYKYASLDPIMPNLELEWFETPERRAEVMKLIDHILLNGDSSNNLAATALVTNAYLYTGDDKYKQWVLDYTQMWIDRTRQNNGILPDNLGLTGKIGEHRNGQFWGGIYGWSHYQGASNMLHSATIAAECALLLSGYYGYTEILRSLVKTLFNNGHKDKDGQHVIYTVYGSKGWQNYYFSNELYPMRFQEVAHLYHATMSKEDYDFCKAVRAGDVRIDWNSQPPEHEKGGGQCERARFQYYDGLNPTWPEKMLASDLEMALKATNYIRNDNSDVDTQIAKNDSSQNPVFTKGLTMVTTGTPQAIYNGGLLRATVRYHDQDRQRPGLPEDVAALVDKLGPDVVGLQLVNTSPTASRSVIVQAGAFCEHRFTNLRHGEGVSDSVSVVPVDSKYFSVQLPPSTAIRVEAGLKRHSAKPSYAFPWHGDAIPSPFQ
ncbi:MAG: hypothetical protein FJ319_02790 [SAR202 cluster bacterium]|nr:hypothetical protein [SAR202 cluster bacterium]